MAIPSMYLLLVVFFFILCFVRHHSHCFSPNLLHAVHAAFCLVMIESFLSLFCWSVSFWIFYFRVRFLPVATYCKSIVGFYSSRNKIEKRIGQMLLLKGKAACNWIQLHIRLFLPAFISLKRSAVIRCRAACWSSGACRSIFLCLWGFQEEADFLPASFCSAHYLLQALCRRVSPVTNQHLKLPLTHLQHLVHPHRFCPSARNV